MVVALEYNNVGEKPTVILYTYIILLAMQGHQTKQSKNNVVVLIIMYDNIVPSNHTTTGAYNLLVEHKERYDIIFGEESYIFVLQQ